MSKKVLPLFFFSLIFVEVYFSKLKLVGDFSLRVPYALLGLLIILFLPKPKLKFSLLLLLPLIYLICNFFSVTLDEYGDMDTFVMDTLLSRFAITFIIAAITIVLVPRYVSVEKFINILLIVLSVNSLAIAAQFLDLSFIWSMTHSITANAFQEVDLIRLKDVHNTFIGFVGIDRSGYLLVVLVPLILYKIENNRHKLFWIILLIFNIGISAILQQRAAFYLVILSVLYYIYFFVVNRNIVSTGIVIFFLLLSFGLYFDEQILYDYEGYLGLLDVKDEIRADIYRTSVDYILRNPIMGGLGGYLTLIDLAPHNLYLNAWIRGGIFGFIVIVWLSLIIFIRGLRTMVTNLDTDNIMWVIYLILINLLGVSFVHNAGLISGEQFTFIFLAMLMVLRSNKVIENEGDEGEYHDE